MSFLLSDYLFELPEALIASHPVEPRDESRLMVLDRQTKTIEHHTFKELSQFLNPNQFLVANNTKVIPARLLGNRIFEGKPSGKIECLLIERGNIKEDEDIWRVLLKTSARRVAGFQFIVQSGDLKLEGEILDKEPQNDGSLWVRFSSDPKAFGNLALPPYIEKKRLNQNESLLNEKDLNAYQTIYSKKGSSCAAPTAGLHFTPRVFDALNEKKILWREITLNVGVGTFRPVKTEDIREHSMHEESFEIDSDLASELTEFKSKRPICAVGTTTLRALESAWDGEELQSGDQKTDVFFYPGSESRIKFVDQLITNFHLPGSTLLMLICHFARDKEFILRAYREAIQKKYRFFSYGDAMLIR